MFGKAARLRAVIRARAVSPEQTIYIGDEIRDGEAARKTGVAFGAVGWGMHTEQSLRTMNPKFFFSSPPEIADRLSGKGKLDE
jgi:phosphoglycolate phosphatase-like HAD superfamily hydrolase